MLKIMQIISVICTLLLFGQVQADARGKTYAERNVKASTGKRLSVRTRANLRHRGDIARQARLNARKSTLARRNTQRIRFNTQARRAGSGYNNVRYDRRVVKPKSILKGSRANRAVHGQRTFTKRLGAQTRGVMTQRGQVARHARKSSQYKRTLARSGKIARHGSKLRSAGKLAGGGFVVYGAEQALGVNVPDAFEATEWTYNTLKQPKNAGRRIEKLGHDSVKTVTKGVRTLTNPKKMSRNITRSVNKTTRSISKFGCKAGKLFGARC